MPSQLYRAVCPEDRFAEITPKCQWRPSILYSMPVCWRFSIHKNAIAAGIADHDWTVE
jgi:hypothetical protein